MKNNGVPAELTLEAIEDEARWAREYLAAHKRQPRAHRDRTAEDELLLWIVREVLRIELLLLARSGDPSLVDRLADTRAQLSTVTGLGDSDDAPMSLVAKAMNLWNERAPGDCDDVLAYCAKSPWWQLRWTAARSLRLDHEPSLSLLEALARDGDQYIKRVAAERLTTRRELPYWSVAFSADPLANLAPAVAKKLQKPIASVCAAFAVMERDHDDARREARRKRVVKRYVTALEALPDALLFDHAKVVLAASGTLGVRGSALLRALGARDGSLPFLHRALSRDDSGDIGDAAQKCFFERHTERSRRDRASAVLQHIRWFHEQESDDSGLSVSLLSHFLPWSELWPERASLRPVFELVIELASKRQSTVATDVLASIKTRRMPSDLREQLVASWARGERATVEETIERESLASEMTPRARRAWVETILRERRSTNAMRWALLQRTGSLFDARRDTSRPALAMAIIDDPGLRAAVLQDRTLTARCIEPLRARFNEGAITRRAELRKFVGTLRDLTGEPDWVELWYFERKRQPRAERRKSDHREDAERFCASAQSLEPISGSEQQLLRVLRRAALQEKGSEATRFDLDLFSTDAWNDADREDFQHACEQLLEDCDGYDAQHLACAIHHQWCPALRPQAEAVIEALERSNEFGADEWVERLREDLASATR